MLGGATRKAFTYGKRGYTPTTSSKKLDESDEEQMNDRRKSTIFLPSQVKKLSSTRPSAINKGASQLSTSPKKAVKLQTTARKSDHYTVKPRSTNTDLHRAPPKKTSLTSIPSPEKRRKDKARLPVADALRSSPRKVQVDIFTTDNDGHQVAKTHRTIRSTHLVQSRAFPNDAARTAHRHERLPKQHSLAHDPFASLMKPPDQSETQQLPALAKPPAIHHQSDILPQAHTSLKKKLRPSAPPVKIDLTSPPLDAEDSPPPISKPPAQRVSRTKSQRTIIISSDSSDGELEASINKHCIAPKVETPAQTRPVFPKPATLPHPRSPPAPVNGHVDLKKKKVVPRRLLSAGINTPKRPAARKSKDLTTSLVRNYGFRSSNLPAANIVGYDDLNNPDLEASFVALDLSDDISDKSESNPDFLGPLLTECRQTYPHDFTTFVETFSTNPRLQQSLRTSSGLRYQKIGEASYSEVFGIGPVVLKIVPLRDANAPPSEVEGDDTPPPSDAEDVLKEILVTKSVSETCGAGFARLIASFIVQGKYPSKLLQSWDEYDSRKGSESVRPDGFSASQTYAVIVLPNGGPDLESFIFQEASASGWQQASSIFWQVTKAVARAESLVQFEHRDLHWGQILIRYANENVTADSSLHVTIIDFGFARMDVQDGAKKIAKWTQLDEEIFEGEGEYQYDVYRMMRRHNGDSWDTYCPLTNVMWLHYLLQKLVNEKGLRAPRNSASATTERKAYERLIYVEQVLNACLLPLKAQTTARRRSIAPKKSKAQWPASAGELLKFALSKGWTKG